MGHSVLVILQLLPLAIAGAVFVSTLKLGDRPVTQRPPQGKERVDTQSP
jgi:hypothetical protein